MSDMYIINTKYFHNREEPNTFTKERFTRIVEALKKLDNKIIALEEYEYLQYLPKKEFSEMGRLTKVFVNDLRGYRYERKRLQQTLWWCDWLC